MSAYGRVALQRDVAAAPPRVLAAVEAPPTAPAPAAAASSDGDARAKVEARLLSMWNNVKYAWTLKTRASFSKESPVWLLGRCYHRKLGPSPTSDDDDDGGADDEPELELATDAAEREPPGDARPRGAGIDGFRRDFASRVWLTYRRDFAPIAGSALTSDCGWGCALRSGQMLLAQALVCHFLGRAWRWDAERPARTTRERRDECRHRAILKWFADRPSAESPLSIHALVARGGRRPGEWYGPAAAAHALRDALRAAAEDSHELDGVRAYVAQDGAVYAEDVRELCARPDGSWRALVALVPVRLGAERFDRAYAPCVAAALSLEWCVGVVGGRPRRSLYFVGYQDDRLIHLDPHYCQEAVDARRPDFPLASFHCRTPRKMPMEKMDPSCCVGFYCADRLEFEAFVAAARQCATPPNGQYPMFVFCEGRSSDVRRVDRPPRYAEDEDRDGGGDTDLECEDFVMV